MTSEITERKNDPELMELEEQLKTAEEQHGSDNAALVEPLEKLAYRCHTLAMYDEAEAHYQRVLSLRNRFIHEDKNGLLFVLHGLAILMRVQNKYADAEPYYAQSLQLVKEQYGERHFETATRQNYLAGLYFAWAKPLSAEVLVTSSLSIYKELLGDDHPVVGIASMGLALICNKQGKTHEASEHFKRADKNLPAGPRGAVMLDFKDLAASLLFLSKEKYKQGLIEEAETLFRYSLVVETDRLWPGHRLVADNVQLLADLYRSQYMLSESEFLYRRALEIRRKVMGAEHLDVAVSANSLGNLLADNKRFEEAEAFLKEAVEIRSKAGFPPLLANSLRSYATVLRQLGRAPEAEEYEKQARNIFAKFTPS